MSLKAVLTVGWRDDATAANSAVRLYEEVEAENRVAALGAALAGEPAPPVVGLDRLLRLRIGGFRKVQRMVAALLDYAAAQADDVYCHVDAFAFAFLAAAKNFDLLLPEAAQPPPALEPERPFRRALPAWTRHMDGLHEFERVGREIPSDHRDAYLALRRIVARTTARDERRILAVMLVGGPSTLEEVSQDLALPYSLGDRVFAALEEAGALARAGDTFVIREDALPTVLFCLRATVGTSYLDLLGPNTWKS